MKKLAKEEEEKRSLQLQDMWKEIKNQLEEANNLLCSTL